MRVRVIGAPMDLGADRRGVDMGTSAIRYANLNARLSSQGLEVHDAGNIVIPQPENQSVGNPKLKYLEPIVRACEELAALVSAALRDGEFPLVIGGDHSIALGSISGVAQAYKEIGVIWVDAHGDFNTGQTSPSGNIHGMILAALAGVGDPALTQLNGWGPKLNTQYIVIVGARDIDSGEQALLRQHGVHVFTMSDIDQQGMTAIMRQAIAIAGQRDGIHLSLDMDGLDPQEAPGVGTPVRGGLNYREAHLAMELIADSGKLLAMDVVEVNPILDRENATALLAVELVLSALGKKIL
jgi:arginase